MAHPTTIAFLATLALLVLTAGSTHGRTINMGLNETTAGKVRTRAAAKAACQAQEDSSSSAAVSMLVFPGYPLCAKA
ncbi:hypothetical protein GGF32_009887 [Allomyces javanicus]|nr:hypothetical protein GGF32_009887 [Allomyces javanicus]